MSTIPYLEQLSDGETLTPTKSAALAFQVKSLSEQRPYKTYRIKFTSGSGTTPAITVFDNTLPGTIAWSTSGPSAGDWYLTSSAFKFTDENTFIQMYKPTFVSTPIPNTSDYSNIFAFIGSGEHVGKLRINYYGPNILSEPVFLELKVYL